MRLAGDWAPKQRTIEPLSWTELLVANLEGPVLSDPVKHLPLKKVGPHIWNQSLPQISTAGVMVLANNHLMDFGSKGLFETLETLSRIGWGAVGAGQHSSAAAKPLVFDWNGARVAIISRCEVQFGIATTRVPGVSVFDPKLYGEIRKLRHEVDLIIASIHAAAEMCPWPSPRRQDAWRALVESGVDVVHGHHSHIPQGWEQYENGLIFYGLGNLCVDPGLWSKHPNALWSLVPRLSLTDGIIKADPLTAVIEDLGRTVLVRDSDAQEAKIHQAYLRECNHPLGDRTLLEALWQEASIRMFESHYDDWLGFSKQSLPNFKQSVRLLIQHAAKFRNFFSLRQKLGTEERRYLLWHVLFACDSHNDAISTALGVLGGAIEDLRNKETARAVDTMTQGLD